MGGEGENTDVAYTADYYMVAHTEVVMYQAVANNLIITAVIYSEVDWSPSVCDLEWVGHWKILATAEPGSSLRAGEISTKCGIHCSKHSLYIIVSVFYFCMRHVHFNS